MRGLSKLVQLFTVNQINFGDLTLYLTYAINANISRTPATVPEATSGRSATAQGCKLQQGRQQQRAGNVRKASNSKRRQQQKEKPRKRWLSLQSGTPATKGWSAHRRATHTTTGKPRTDACNSKNIGNSRVDSSRDTISSRDASKAIITYHLRIYCIAIFKRYF